MRPEAGNPFEFSNEHATSQYQRERRHHGRVRRFTWFVVMLVAGCVVGQGLGAALACSFHGGFAGFGMLFAKLTAGSLLGGLVGSLIALSFCLRYMFVGALPYVTIAACILCAVIGVSIALDINFDRALAHGVMQGLAALGGVAGGLIGSVPGFVFLLVGYQREVQDAP